MRHLAFSVAIAIVAVASTARAQDTTTVVETQTTTTPIKKDLPTEERTFLNRPMMLVSGGLLLATYVPSAAIGAKSDRDADRFLFIPVAGPWIDLANRDCDAAGVSCNNESRNKGLLIGSGILQGIGAIGVVASFLVPETRPVRQVANNKPTISIAPAQLTRTGYGIGAVGTF